ncbi:MAG: Hpt domain-containing protein [Planctomycetes bacterium]|nr:Hpt domain-containing protein [Planctomycetota bacterium]
MIPHYQDLPVFDEETALGLFEHDRELLDEVVALFRSSARRLLAEIEEFDAAGPEQREELVRSAHSLKGAAANVAAERIRCLAAALEKAGRQSLGIPAAVDFTAFIESLRTEISVFDSQFECA